MKYTLIIIELALLIYIAYTGFVIVQYLGQMDCQDYSGLKSLIERQRNVISQQEKETIELLEELGRL